MVSLELLKKLKIWYKPLKRGDLAALAAAGGALLKILGTVELDIEVRGQIMKFEFCVLGKLHPDLILGMNFLKEHKANIDCDNDSISFFNNDIAVKFESACGDPQVSLLNDCLLKPRSETIIPVQCSDEFTGEGIITPVQAGSEDLYGVARLLVKPENRKTICRIMNPTNEEILLHKGLVVGKIESIEDEPVIEIDTKSTTESNKINEKKEKSDEEILTELEIKTTGGELNAEQQKQAA